MADKEDGKNQAEPTMEEILASIRRIIADEKDPNAAPEEKPAGTEDVLELTQMVQEDGSVVDLAATPPTQEEPVAPPPSAPPSPPTPPSQPQETSVESAPTPVVSGDDLLSEKAATSAASSLATLASTVQIERMAAGVPPLTPLGNGGRTLESMVLEIMKPMIKDWLDQNLPATVEKLVQKEIERIAHNVQD